ncbi:MAG: glycosyltransferase [Syntrophaceae bacterium]|nr:glycosyltransferase [Syntrophaceae bacterium]
MKKILCVLPRVTGGGAERFFITFLQHIDRSYYKPVVVLMCRGGGFDHEIPDNISVYTLQEMIKNIDRALPLGPLRYFRALKTVIRLEEPDAIISFGSLFNGAVAFSSHMANFKGPVILIEAVHESSEISKRHGFGKWGRKIFLRWTYPLSSAIVAVSSDVASDLRDHFGLTPQKLHVVYYGIDLKQVRTLSKELVVHPWLCGPHGYTIVACGRLVPQKGFGVLISAMSDLPDDVRLIIIGDGEEKIILEKQIQKLGLQGRIDLIGYDRNPYRYMARADLFVMPSLWEGFGIVLIEAMALGCAVIAADCPTGPREILGDGEYGILVRPGDPIALASGIQRLLSDKKLKVQQSSFARNRAEEFTAQRSVHTYIKLLSVLGEWK